MMLLLSPLCAVLPVHTAARAHTHALTIYKQGTRSRTVEFGDEEEFATCFGRTIRVRYQRDTC